MRQKAATSSLQTIGSQSTSWWNRWGWGSSITESYTGAWQQNVTLDSQSNQLSFSAVYCCVTGIASDVAKMRVKLDKNLDGIWTEVVTDAAWLPVLRKPNHYQTRLKFFEQWVVSKLLSGNTYVLKERDKRGIVNRLYILDPQRVKVLVAESGDVYYELQVDYLSGVQETVTVPAREIIHDMMVSLWHPLIGVSPMYACAISATMGNKIQANSTNLFGNASRPGGMLMAPGAISDETAARLKAAFEANFSGANVGRLAVLGDGLKFEPMTLTAEANQLAQQLEWTVQDVARAFHYPGYKMGGALPPYSSGPQALTMMYYTDCLQPIIEAMEMCLDEGLELPEKYGTEFDLDNLLRMDTMALYDANAKAVGAGWMKPDEARFRANYAPTDGGDTPYLQQQNYGLAALKKRDKLPDPFGTGTTPEPATPPADKPALPPAPKEWELLALEAYCKRGFFSDDTMERT